MNLPDKEAKMLSDFLIFNRENPGIYRLFHKFAQQALQSGRQRYSSWAIANAIRWHSDIVVRTKDFKLPNNYIAAYARLWIQRNPKHRGLIAIKRSMWDGLDLKTLVET